MLKRGSITLELLITIVVSTPLLLSIITVLKESIGVHLRVMIESQDNESLLRLRSIIHETIVELDQHRLELPARIHHAGQIRFSNNTDNPVMRSRTNPPATNSDAITSAKLAVQNSLIVNQAITLGSRIIFTCCERFAEPFNKDDYKSYLGVHADGVIELTGSLTQLSSAPSCWELNATPEISMIADSSNPDLTGNIRLIIPIDRLYTIYLNDKEELRFL